MPGEIARAHRHTADALLQLIIERLAAAIRWSMASAFQCIPGDLVLTPNWCWHDHANDTDAPMIWLDGLDTPLVRMLEASFFEEHPEDRQEISAPVNASQWHYPMSEMRVELQRLAATQTGNEPLVLEYKNRTTGGPVMPTIACYTQMLRPGEKARAWRRVCCTNYHIVEGSRLFSGRAASGSTGKTRMCSPCRRGRSASTSTAAIGRPSCSASAMRR